MLSKNYFDDFSIEIYLNSRDDYDKNDLYLTAIGSAVESGDEGAVGRGNRTRGVIPFARNFSMEASCGKNPVYHTGKLFAAIGDIISKEIYDKFGYENVVYCTSKMGDEIDNPWNVSVELNKDISSDEIKMIEDLVDEKLKNHKSITNQIISGELKLNSY